MTSPAHRTFVSYIDKSREYYANEGYDVPYRWAFHQDAPFSPLNKPLSECTVGVITTTKFTEVDKLRPYAAPSDDMPDAVYTDHLFWHKGATTTDDLGSYLPIAHLQDLAHEGVIGAVSQRFYGAPTVYSQRRTQSNAEEIAQWVAEDGVDIVLLHPL